MSTSETPVLTWLRLLADQTRLRLLELLADGEHGVEELASAVGVTAPTVSHHLTKLREAGLVRVRADANRRLHSLDAQALQQAYFEIAGHFGFGAAAPAPCAVSAAPDPQDPVDAYLHQGQITEIPTQRTARLLVLDWVARLFDPKSSYREPEITRRLAEVTPNPDNLRRMLLDYGLLHRVGKTYWLREEAKR